MPLAELTTLRLGGPPRRIVTATSETDALVVVREADAAGEPLLILGGGSNLVVADEGFPGTVLKIATRGVTQRERADGAVAVELAAGEPWDAVVAASVGDGLAGIECLSGIPGSTGATPIQNVGAYGQDLSQTVVAVRAFDRAAGELHRLTPGDCEFGYRTSAFKRRPGRWLVLSVELALAPTGQSTPIRYPELARELGVELGASAPLANVRDAVLRVRRRKGMVIDPDDPDSVSAGSFFTNPILARDDYDRLAGRVAERLGPDVAPPRFPEPDGRLKTSAAWLVERAGFAPGYGLPGPAALSTKHALALTNRGGARTADLLALARTVAAGVHDAFGVELVPEPVLVGVEWSPRAKPR